MRAGLSVDLSLSGCLFPQSHKKVSGRLETSFSIGLEVPDGRVWLRALPIRLDCFEWLCTFHPSCADRKITLHKHEK